MLGYRRNFPYTTVAGMHWPDIRKGTKTKLALDLTCSVEAEKENITNITWSSAPDGLDILTSYTTDAHEAQVQVQARKAGYYTLTAQVDSIDAGIESTEVIEVNLKVN